jgi:hypothetical protein
MAVERLLSPGEIVCRRFKMESLEEIPVGTLIVLKNSRLEYQFIFPKEPITGIEKGCI